MKHGSFASLKKSSAIADASSSKPFMLEGQERQ